MNSYKEIKEQADIVEVVGYFIKIKRVGKSYRAICPFHDDHNPSLYIDPVKQLYKCFSCNAGGTVIKFVKEYKKISYFDAAKKVSEICGLSIKLEKNTLNQPKENYQKLYQIINDSIIFYNYGLVNNKNNEGYKFLKNRGLDDQTMMYFKLGYAPFSKNNLINFLLNKGYTKEEILKTGLALVNQNNQLVDFFKNRVIYPYKNENNQYIGLSGRILDNGEVKYLSLPNTVIYNKSSQLFNYINVLNNFKECILVEGFHDVITLWMKGIKNAIAISGTLLSNDQLNKLKKFSCVIPLLDIDKAGQIAQKLIINKLINNGIDVKLPITKINNDPDEYFKNKDKIFINDFFSKYKKINKTNTSSIHQFQDTINNYSNHTLNPNEEVKINGNFLLIRAEEILLYNILKSSGEKIKKFYFDNNGLMATEEGKEIADYLLFLYKLNFYNENSHKARISAFNLLSENAKQTLLWLANLNNEKLLIKKDIAWKQTIEIIKKHAKLNALSNKK